MAETIVDLLAETVARHDRRLALLIKPAFRTRRWRYRDLARLAPSVTRKIHRLSWIDQRGAGTSLRGDVEVIFGQPIHFSAGTDAAAATGRLEEAVAAL